MYWKARRWCVWIETKSISWFWSMDRISNQSHLWTLDILLITNDSHEEMRWRNTHHTLSLWCVLALTIQVIYILLLKIDHKGHFVLFKDNLSNETIFPISTFEQTTSTKSTTYHPISTSNRVNWKVNICRKKD